MDTTTVFAAASLLVAFLGGMVMLFAPCCITLMLPAYLGSAFKAKSKVILMTLVFAAGVASVILPIVLGAQFLTSFFSQYHTLVFIVGSLLMISVGMMALFSVTFKLPFVSRLQSPRVTNLSTAYSLGLVSGLSSACCAPVLFGALTLAALSPSNVHALAVGLSYTAGIVFPLFILGLFFQKSYTKWGLRLQRKSVAVGSMKVPIANFASFVIFTLAGFVFLFLALTNKNTAGMGGNLTVQMKSIVNTIAQQIQRIPYSDVIFGLVLLVAFGLVLYVAYKQLRNREE